MDISIHSSNNVLAKAVAYEASGIINMAIKNSGEANIILATGMTQIPILEELVKQNIDWSKVTAFHLDDYVGLPSMHPSSFQFYLQERFVNKVNNLKKMYFIMDSEKNIDDRIKELENIISKVKIDVVFLGLGNNGHIAFNEPPADFNVESSFIKIALAEKSREQQYNQGWFKTMEEVPKTAVTMSISQILKSDNILLIAMGKNKAEIVNDMVNGNVTKMLPASILQTVNNVHIHLDNDSASKL